MHNLSISVKNNYVTLKIKNKTIRYLATPALIGYKSVKEFDRTSGVITLLTQFHLFNGEDVEEEDWIDLKSELGFAFKNPEKIINEIENIHLLN